MHAIVQRRLRTQYDWEQVWLSQTSVPAIIRELSEKEALEPKLAAEAAIHFIGGHLKREGFRLFRNGGLPLLERRTGPLIEELIIRSGPHGVKGAYVPISMQIHVSHDGLRQIRDRYWKTAGRPPVVLASGNSGLIQTEPTWDIWNVSSTDSCSELLTFLDDEVLEYYDDLASPTSMQKGLFWDGIPLIDACTAIEYLLCEFGRAEARRYLHEVVLNTEETKLGFQTVLEFVQSSPSLYFQAGQLLRNIAVIVNAYNLDRRR